MADYRLNGGYYDSGDFGMKSLHEQLKEADEYIQDAEPVVWIGVDNLSDGVLEDVRKSREWLLEKQ